VTIVGLPPLVLGLEAGFCCDLLQFTYIGVMHPGNRVRRPLALRMHAFLACGAVRSQEIEECAHLHQPGRPVDALYKALTPDRICAAQHAIIACARASFQHDQRFCLA
jgi:hypothetical protein